MSGPAKLKEDFIFELDICYNLSFTEEKGEDIHIYSSVLDYIEKNKIDQYSDSFENYNLILEANKLKLQQHPYILNIVLNSAEDIDFPYDKNMKNCNILKVLRYYFLTDYDNYNKLLERI